MSNVCVLGLRASCTRPASHQVCAWEAAASRLTRSFARSQSTIMHFRSLTLQKLQHHRRWSAQSTLLISRGVVLHNQYPVQTTFTLQVKAAFSSKRRAKPPPPRSSQSRTKKTNNSDIGIPFRDTDLTKTEVQEIFGPGADPVSINHIMRVLHYMRVTGEPINSSIFQMAPINPEYVDRGLAWLRENVPVDEEAAIMEREAEERAKYEVELIADAERIGLYKPQQQARRDMDVYGKSGLDEIRKHYESELDKKLASEERADKKRMSQRTAERSRALGTRANMDASTIREEPEWVKRYREKAVVIPGGELPKMGKLRRLYPSFLVTLLTIFASYTFATSYTPPAQSDRIFPDMPPAPATVIGLILANSAILIAWRIPPLWPVLNRYFLTIPVYPRALSVLGNVFSHQEFSHFALNMFTLYLIGTRLHDDIGRGPFLALFLSAGAFSSFFSLANNVLRGSAHTSSLGASGTICGLIACMCIIHSQSEVRPIFLPEGWAEWLHFKPGLFLALMLVAECIGLARGTQRIDHWAHLGGYIAGMTSGYFLTTKAQTRNRPSFLNKDRGR